MERVKTRYVRQADVVIIQTQLQNYLKLRKLVDCWIDLGTELSDLTLAHPKQK